MNVRVAIGFGKDDVSTLQENLSAVTAAIQAGGGAAVAVEEANALVWLSLDGQLLKDTLASHPNIQWVQLPWAGVETFSRAGIFDTPPQFTCAKSAFGGEVGEHAFFLILACLRNAVRMARTKRWEYVSPVPGGIAGKRVTVLGGGGIATTLVNLLYASGAETTVLRRTNASVAGATRTLTIDSLHDVLPDTDILALCLPLTSSTEGLITANELKLMPRGSILVNVARGKIVDTDALVAALDSRHLLAAGLDVTEPEPLPEGHRLWDFDNVLITSHSADSDEYCDNKLSERIETNVRHFANGELLEGLVDKQAGY